VLLKLFVNMTRASQKTIEWQNPQEKSNLWQEISTEVRSHL